MMKRHALWTLLIGAAVGLSGATEAQAQLTATAPDCDFLVALGGTFSPEYGDCSGAWEGNPLNQTPDVYDQIEADWGYSSVGYIGTSEEGGSGGPFLAISGDANGTLEFATPFTGSFVLALKAANQFSLYLFEGVDGLVELDYTTSGVSLNGSGRPQGLSGASLYVVDEPATWLLLASALLGLVFVSRRRRLEASA